MAIILGIVVAIISLLVTLAFQMVGYDPPEFYKAKVLFILSVSILFIVTFIWAAITNRHIYFRSCVIIVIAFVIGIGLPRSLKWVNKRESQYIASQESIQIEQPKQPAIKELTERTAEQKEYKQQLKEKGFSV